MFRILDTPVSCAAGKRGFSYQLVGQQILYMYLGRQLPYPNRPTELLLSWAHLPPAVQNRVMCRGSYMRLFVAYRP